jgi:hypothetical protein
VHPLTGKITKALVLLGEKDGFFAIALECGAISKCNLLTYCSTFNVDHFAGDLWKDLAVTMRLISPDYATPQRSCCVASDGLRCRLNLFVAQSKRN